LSRICSRSLGVSGTSFKWLVLRLAFFSGLSVEPGVWEPGVWELGVCVADIEAEGITVDKTRVLYSGH
jgi:hypothetical protein